MEHSLTIPTLFQPSFRLSRSRAFLFVSLAVLLLAVVEKGLPAWCSLDSGAGICSGFSLGLNFFLEMVFITLVVLIFDGPSDRLLLYALAASLVYHAGMVIGGWIAPVSDPTGLNIVRSSMPVFLGQTVLVAVMRILIPAGILRYLTRGSWYGINALSALKFGLFLVLLSASLIAMMFTLATLAAPGAATTGFVLTVENVSSALLSLLAVWVAAMFGKQIRERA